MPKLLSIVLAGLMTSLVACAAPPEAEPPAEEETSTVESELPSPQCFATCKPTSPCNQFCIEGDTPFNCGGHGVCNGL